MVVAAKVTVDHRASGSSPIRAVPMMWPAPARVAVLEPLSRAFSRFLGALRGLTNPALV